MAIIVLALIVVPFVEIYVLLQIGHAIGVLPTVALLIADAVLGAWLVRREGARTWSAFVATLGSGRLPAREVADGALVIFGGALLLTPGFVTDIVGVLCIVAPTRALLRRALMAYVARRGARGRSQGPTTLRVRSQRQDEAAPARRDHSVIDGNLSGRDEPPRS